MQYECKSSLKEEAMRFEIELEPKYQNYSLSLNYNYPVMVNIYKIFFSGEPEFSEWLHNTGYQTASGKRYKLFTFSQIITNKGIENNGVLKTHGNAKIYFSAPDVYSHIPAFVNGVFKKRTFNLYDGKSDNSTFFTMKGISVISEPIYNEVQKYKMLSPTLISLKNENDEVSYIEADDPRFVVQIEKNLIEKYRQIHNKDYQGIIRVMMDMHYIERRKAMNKHISKKITVKAGRQEETELRAFIAPLVIEAQPEMQKVAYDCGIGEKNSFGLGMLEIIK